MWYSAKMTITKYLHSCVLLEEADKRILIDPGSFSFAEGLVKPEQIPLPDLILITHEHSDHFFPEALHVLTQGGAQILSTPNVVQRCRDESLKATVLKPGETFTLGPFTIAAVEAAHEDLPLAKPQNVAFLVNGLLHPGDSLHTKLTTPPAILALPVTAPWMRVLEAVECAKKLKPQTVIPIHDGYVKDFFLGAIHAMVRSHLEPEGMRTISLGPGESFTL